MIDCGPSGGGRGLRGALREFAAMRFPVCNLVVVRKKEEQVFTLVAAYAKVQS